MDFLEVQYEVGGVRGENLKFGTYGHTSLVLEIIPFSSKTPAFPGFFFFLLQKTQFSNFVRSKVAANKNVSFADRASRIWFVDFSKLAKHQSLWHDVIVFFFFFFWRCFFFFFWVIRDWPEIRKLEIHPFEFCSISGDWSKLGIPNLAEMSVIKCYSKLQNAKVTAFTVFELLRENQLVI